MRTTISFFACVFAVAATVVAFSNPGFAVETKNPAKPATGQQIDKYCNPLKGEIQKVLIAVNDSIKKVQADNGPDKSFANSSLQQLNAAVESIGKLNNQIGTSAMTYALAFSVYGHMDEVTEFLQRARYQIMASASNNQSIPARDAFGTISGTITMAQAIGVLAGRCYMSPYVGG